MKLVYSDRDFYEHFIGEYDSVEDARKAIMDWCLKHGKVDIDDLGDKYFCLFERPSVTFNLYK